MQKKQDNEWGIKEKKFCCEILFIIKRKYIFKNTVVKIATGHQTLTEKSFFCLWKKLKTIKNAHMIYLRSSKKSCNSSQLKFYLRREYMLR